MKLIKTVIILLLFSQITLGQGKYTFSKNFTKTDIGDWIQFGQINTLPAGTFINVKAWAHYTNQLFYLEFEIPAVTYGNDAIDWVEVAPKLSNGHNAFQNFALDAKYKCTYGCAMELRLRRLYGGGVGGTAGTISFVVESNAAFYEANIEGVGGVVSPGYLGSNAGWKFPVSTSMFGNSKEGLFIGRDGNISIGTTVASEKLSVKGKIRAQEVKVEMNGWSDFVFAKDYKLPSLKETEKHIKENGHLPGIPSAAEVEKNGIELGDMNAKLLQKIEELTLYLIEMKKENGMIRKDNEAKNKKLQDQINKLTPKQK
jgi:hypothetical protein